MHQDGRLSSAAEAVAAARGAAAFQFPECVEHYAVYLEKIETRWLDTLLQRGWLPGEHAEPHARAAIDAVLSAQLATPPPRAAPPPAAAAAQEAVPPPPAAGDADSADTVPLAAVHAAQDDAASTPAGDAPGDAEVPPPPPGPGGSAGKHTKAKGRASQKRRISVKAAPTGPPLTTPGVPSAFPEDSGDIHDPCRHAHNKPVQHSPVEHVTVAEDNTHIANDSNNHSEQWEARTAPGHSGGAEGTPPGPHQAEYAEVQASQDQVHMHAVHACAQAWRHAKHEVLRRVLGLDGADESALDSEWQHMLGGGREEGGREQGQGGQGSADGAGGGDGTAATAAAGPQSGTGTADDAAAGVPRFL